MDGVRSQEAAPLAGRGRPRRVGAQDVEDGRRPDERVGDGAPVGEGERGDEGAVEQADEHGAGQRPGAVEVGEVAQRGRVGGAGKADRQVRERGGGGGGHATMFGGKTIHVQLRFLPYIRKLH